MAKKKDEVTIHSSAAEYLTYVAAVGDMDESMEIRYEDENILLNGILCSPKIAQSPQNKIYIQRKFLREHASENSMLFSINTIA